MKELFDKIRITDLDIDLTQTSQEASGFRRLYLKLSGEPPPEWVKIFEQERRFPPHPIWRNSWVVGAHIVIDCVPEELEQFGLNHLKEDVANANNKFLESSARNDADDLRQFQEKEAVGGVEGQAEVRLRRDGFNPHGR
ncbi:MAG: hypothetical protein ACLQU3_05060 [Limisphaerales bacterium]